MRDTQKKNQTKSDGNWKERIPKDHNWKNSYAIEGHKNGSERVDKIWMLPEGKLSMIHLQIHHSFLDLFEVWKILWILQSLQKSIDIFQVRHFCFDVSHSTGQHIRYCSLSVELPAYFLVNTAKQFALLVTLSPCAFKALEILQLQTSYPLVKNMWLWNLPLNNLNRFFVI